MDDTIYEALNKLEELKVDADWGLERLQHLVEHASAEERPLQKLQQFCRMLEMLLKLEQEQDREEDSGFDMSDLFRVLKPR